MSFNFPNSPTDGQLFVPVANGPSYTWSAAETAWMITSGGLSAGVYIGDLPPANPAVGQLWWNSTTGLTFIWFNDGNSSQWVQFNTGPLPSDPYRFNTADMSLLSMALGKVGLNSKADGSGTSGQLWSDLNTLYSASGNGYLMFPGGMCIEWGYVASGGDPVTVTFPRAYAAAPWATIATPVVGAITNIQSCIVNLDNHTSTQAIFRTRYSNNGGLVGVASQGFFWASIGRAI